MKPSTLFNAIATVLLIGAQAMHATADKANDSLDDTPRSLRGLARSSTSFEKYGGMGCRTSSGSAGTDGIDYMLLKHMSKETCKSKCIDIGKKCTGWEYTKGGKCEVWKKPIEEDELAKVPGVDCYIKDAGSKRLLKKTTSSSEDGKGRKCIVQNKLGHCRFHKDNRGCGSQFGNGFEQISTQKCGLIRFRRNCQKIVCE